MIFRSATPFVALVAFALAPAAAVAQAADPAAALEAYNGRIVAIMTARLPIDARVTRFEKLVDDYYDMGAIAALVVGPKWAGASAGDKAAVIDALGHHSALALAKNFVAFNGEKFSVDNNIASRGTSSVVKVTITGKTSSNRLQYRLRQTPAGWRIVDVVSEGVSQLALQRAELAGTIATEGVGGMAKKLAARDAELIKRP